MPYVVLKKVNMRSHFARGSKRTVKNKVRYCVGKKEKMLLCSSEIKQA